MPALTTNVFLVAHAITACTLGTMATPLPSRTSFFACPATGNPAFLDRQRCDAFRFTVRPFPLFICGCAGKLTGTRRPQSLGTLYKALPFPEGSRNLPC